MAVNKIILERDGLIVGDTQLVASGGGVTVGQNLVVIGNTFLQGNLNTYSNVSLNVLTPSISSSTGALVVTGTGGIGVGGNISIGSGIYVSGSRGSNNQIMTSQGTDSVIWRSFDLLVHAPDSSYKKIVRVATVGTSITLSGGAPNTLDGVTLQLNDRILVKDQTNPAQNGIYYVTAIGTGSNGSWYRSFDSDSSTDIDGATVGVSEGTVNGGRRYQTYWLGTNTLDVTPMYWNRLADVNSSSTLGLQTTAVGLDLATPGDTVTMATGSLADLAVNSIGARTLAAVGSSTYTRASSLYLAGPPIASTNATITNAYSLYVASGNIAINTITGPSAVANDATVPTSSWVRLYGGSRSANVYAGTAFTFSNTAGFVPPGVGKIRVTVVGGGGAGGGCPATVDSRGAGGGAGGQSIVYLTNVAGLQFWANVGAGGVPVTNANGGTGNISVFTLAGTIYATASGGVGGSVGSGTPTATSVLGGVGGAGATGNINLTGSAGASIAGTGGGTAGQSVSGSGAPGYMGSGGAVAVRTAAVGSAAGVAGTSGGGGSGAIAGAATATTNIGGAGGPGLIIVEW